jgi:competence protein ComEA
MIPTMAAVALACGRLSALSTARVSSNPGAGVAPASAQTTGSAPAAEKLDINTAPKDQLQTLPGIGDAYSQKIIDGRPDRSKLDLVHKNIMPRASYDKIRVTPKSKRKSSPSSRRPPGRPRLPPHSSIASKGGLAEAVAGMTRFRVSDSACG